MIPHHHHQNNTDPCDNIDYKLFQKKLKAGEIVFSDEED